MTNKTSAQICKENGWKVGDLLKGTEDWGYGETSTSVILITAIGEDSILARKILRSRGSRLVHVSEDELRWCLCHRQWVIFKW